MGCPVPVFARRRLGFMERDPRLIARSESDSGTAVFRPESSRPRDGRSQTGGGPLVDVDELIRLRDAEMASDQRWRVRLGEEELFWDSIGGYTTYSANAKKWPSRWDAYNDMQAVDTGRHGWSIELVARPRGAVASGLARNARRGELMQAWTRPVVSGPQTRPAPDDGMVHALAGDNTPGFALCGTEVGYWTGSPWPPRGIRRCERCNSIATVLPD